MPLQTGPDEATSTPAAAPEAARRLLARWPLGVLGGIVLVAFLLRVIDVANNPLGFFTDEAAAGLDGHAILTTGKDMYGTTMPFLFRNLEDYKLPVFIYAQVPFIAVLGLSEFSVRFTVVVLGTLTVVTTWLLARELLRRPEAAEGAARLWTEAAPLAAAGLLAVLPWHIHYSRTGFGEMVSFPLLFTLGWFLFLRAHRTAGSWLPAAVVFGLCFYTYRGGWVVLPPFLLLLLLLYHRELLRKRRDALLGGLAFLVMLLPLAYHLLWGEGDRASAAWIFNLDSERGTLALAWEQYRSYFTRHFLFDAADDGFLLRHYLPGQGVLYWFMAPLLAAGLLRIAMRLGRSEFLLLALLLLYPLSGAVSDTSPISTRTILGSVVFSLIAAVGFAALVELIAAWRPAFWRPALAGGAVLLVLAASLSAAGYVQRYHSDYPALSSGFWGWQDGPEAITHRFVALHDAYDELYMDGMFNAPHVFFRFYAGDDCARCRIGGPERYNPALRQLFALRAENRDLPGIDYVIRETLYYPDGTPSFHLLEITGTR